MHLLPHRPRRGRGRVRREPRQPVDRRALPARRGGPGPLAETLPALAGKDVFAVIWTTTPWTLPANLALAFHPEADYGFFPVEGTNDVLLAGEVPPGERRGALGAGIRPARCPPSASPLAEVKGAELEHVRFRHPWIDRDSPGVLGDYVTLDTGTGVVHTAPATAGTTT